MKQGKNQKYKNVKSKINHKDLNPIFHLQTKKEDETVLTRSKILEARRTGVLKLCKKGLGTVPDKVWKLNEPDPVESRNSLTLDMDALPDTQELKWWEYQELKELDLSSNAISTIPGDVAALESLESLLMQENCLTTLPNEIGALRNLKTANLSHNKIESLPKELFDLIEIQNLHLDHNQLTHISNDLSNLIMLETLDLSHNNLTNLPDIGFLVRLQQLVLTNNKLKQLPPDITSLRSLRVLNISNNSLKTLDSNLSELRKLETLDAKNNSIEEFPTFEQSSNIKELYLSDNGIKIVPDTVCVNLNRLLILELQNNKLESLPENVNDMNSLERVDLSNNNLKKVPSKICHLIHLKELKLLGNPIQTIRSDILRGGTLRILKYLRESQMFDTTTKSNEENLNEDKEKLSNLNSMKQTIAMRKKKSFNLPSNPDDGMLDLSKLVLEAKKAEVTTLDLRSNQLANISEDFKELAEHVVEINLNENILEALPSFLGDFKQLLYLNVSCNKIGKLPDELGNLKLLKELDISYNKIMENISEVVSMFFLFIQTECGFCALFLYLIEVTGDKFSMGSFLLTYYIGYAGIFVLTEIIHDKIEDAHSAMISEISWDEIHPAERRTLCLMMAQKPFVFMAGGYFPMSFLQLKEITSSGYSYSLIFKEIIH